MDHSTKPVSLKVPEIPKVESAGGGFLIGHPEHHATAWWRGAFNNAELEAIIRLGKRMQMQEARTVGQDDHSVRKSRTSWIYPNAVSGWLFDRLAGVIAQANAEFFRFDLYGLLQGLQFTEYAADGSHYSWHVDRGPTVGIRKLSLSLLLSDPDDFDGGQLEFNCGGEPFPAQQERGLVTLFPSWTLHRVTPVTRGTRYSLVAWTSGPPFK